MSPLPGLWRARGAPGSGHLVLAVAAGLVLPVPAAQASAQAADGPPPWRWSVQTGVGHESQSSPLFQVTPEATVVYLPGLERRAGTHALVRAEAQSHLVLPEGQSLSTRFEAMGKRAPSSPGFDLGGALVQPTWHWSAAGAGWGLGATVQRIAVGGAHFRDVSGVQASWVLPQERGFWTAVADLGRYRHKGMLADLDASARSLMVMRRWDLGDDASSGLDGLTLSALAGRERNARGLAELSYRQVLLSACVEGQLAGADWTLRWSTLRARFDGSVFAGDGLRQDRAQMLDASVQWPLPDQAALRLEWNQSWNRSGVRVFNNHYRQVSVSWVRSF